MENNNFFKYNLKDSLKIIKEFDWLIDSYILDFYVKDHWTKLPNSWKSLFESIEPANLAEILNENNDSSKSTRVWPLSLLCLKVLKQKLCIKRSLSKEMNFVKTQNLIKHPNLKNFFNKSIKQKKQHEIIKMASICYDSALKTNTKYIVDFGAGLGHLARLLSFNYGLKICCLEMRDELNVQARTIDEQLKTAIAKYAPYSEYSKYSGPDHITFKLTEYETPEAFVDKIKCAFSISKDCTSFNFGIVGLHPCGNLAAILIKLFLKIEEAKFLNLVGCCYMKLNDYGYPLSNFAKLMPNLCSLSYESKEISCHAIEIYKQQLEHNNYLYLRIHSYRAALEKLIIRFNPEYKNTGMKSIKFTDNLTFREYCAKAVNNLPIYIPICEIESNNIEDHLKNWKQIVFFYSMRLFFAPLIESIILYDRILCLMENESKVSIKAIFDPYISPRNHIITAIKN